MYFSYTTKAQLSHSDITNQLDSDNFHCNLSEMNINVDECTRTEELCPNGIIVDNLQDSNYNDNTQTKTSQGTKI